MDDPVSAYRAWAAGQPKLPLFHQPWWLDTLAGRGGWQAVFSRDADGKVTGVLPFSRGRRMGVVDLISNPLLTPYLGPFIVYPEEQKRERRYTHAKRVLVELARALPDASLVFIKASPDLDYTIPMHWQGFRQASRYTFRIPAGTRLPSAFEGLKGSVRTAIRKAEGDHVLERAASVGDFFPLNRNIFRKQGIEPPYSQALLEELHREASRRGQGEVWLIRNAAGELKAGAFVALDDRYAYLLATGRSLDQASSIHLSFLLWQIVTDTLERGRGFDFEGSMLEGVEHYFRSFGGILTPYPYFFRAKNRFWELAALLARRF